MQFHPDQTSIHSQSSVSTLLTAPLSCLDLISAEFPTQLLMVRESLELFLHYLYSLFSYVSNGFSFSEMISLNSYREMKPKSRISKANNSENYVVGVALIYNVKMAFPVSYLLM